MKKFRLIMLLLLALLFTGCLAPTVRLAVSPDPIEIEFGQAELADVVLKLSLSGFGFSYRLEQAVVEVKDEDGTPFLKKEVELNTTIPVVVPFFSRSKDLGPIDLSGLWEKLLEESGQAELTPDVYAEHIRGKELNLIIILKGSKDSAPAEAKIKFI